MCLHHEKSSPENYWVADSHQSSLRKIQGGCSAPQPAQPARGMRHGDGDSQRASRERRTASARHWICCKLWTLKILSGPIKAVAGLAPMIVLAIVPGSLRFRLARSGSLHTNSGNHVRDKQISREL